MNTPEREKDTTNVEPEPIEMIATVTSDMHWETFRELCMICNGEFYTMKTFDEIPKHLHKFFKPREENESD